MRSAFIDNVKGVSCLFIMLHHLAFYGPMSDVAMIAIPETIDFLIVYGRMAVAVFLVIGGFLTGQKLFEKNLFSDRSVLQLIWHKYRRLAVPYLAAIALAIICSYVASHLMQHSSISEPPTITQLISHLFFTKPARLRVAVCRSLVCCHGFSVIYRDCTHSFLINDLILKAWSHKKLQE